MTLVSCVYWIRNDSDRDAMDSRHCILYPFMERFFLLLQTVNT